MISHVNMFTPRLLDAVRRVDNRARTIMERLATGLRINDMGDDPGGQVSVDLLNADTRSLAMTLVNINGGISLGTVAQDALDHVDVLLEQMGDLATEASKAYMGSPERLVLNSQYLNLRDQIETIALDTEYDNIKLLDGSMAGGTPAESALVTAPVAQVTTLAVDEAFTFEDWGIFSGMSAAARTITFDGFVAGTPAEAAEVTAPVAQTTDLALDETFTFEDWGIFAGMSAAARSITFDGDVAAIPATQAEVTAPVAQVTNLALDETFTFEDWGIFAGMSAASRTITFDGDVAAAPATPAVVTASVAQTKTVKKAEVLEFEDYGLFGGMSAAQRQISFAVGLTQTQVVNAINADADISPLVTASVDGSGQLELTSVTTGASATFRVFSDQGAKNNQTGIGTTPLEGTGTDATPADPGFTQTEVVNAINADADISPLITASVNGSGELVITSVATGTSARFRVSSDVAAAGDSTGLGTGLLEDTGEDTVPADPGFTQIEVVNAINADADISPLITASVNGSGELVLTSVATGASAQFRVSADVAAASDSTGLGTGLLEDAGVDAVPDDPGFTQTEVVNAINADADISPLVTASVNGSGELVLTSVATGASIAFRVSSDIAAASDTTGLGTGLLEDAGTDAAVGTGGMEIQAHIHHVPPDSTIGVEIDPVTLDALGLTGSNISSLSNAQTAVTAVAAADDELIRATGQVDAIVARLAFAANNALSGQAETHKAILRIQTVDEAQDILALAVVQIIQNSSKAMLAQARITPQMAITLI